MSTNVKSTHRQPEAACWTSFSKYVFQEYDKDFIWKTSSQHGFMLSVILDAGIWAEFSGIDVLIVLKERDISEEKGIPEYVMIRDCLKPSKYKIKQSGEPASARNILARRRNAVEESKSIRAVHSDKPRNALPLCTVVFEMVYLSSATTKCYELVPRLGAAPDGTFRIVYRRAYPCTQTSHSVLAFLESSVSFRGNLLMSSPKPPIGIPHHSLRILPLFRERRPAAQLPPSIICQIVGYAVRGHWQADWRVALANYGLVCKSWSCVYRLFFEINSTQKPGMKAPAAAVARWLESCPKHRGLVRGVAADHFQAGSCELTGSRDLVTILSLATSVTEVHLGDVEAAVVPDLVSALVKLRKVAKFSFRKGNGWDRGLPLSINDMQTAIGHWPDLRACSIEGPRTHYDMVPQLLCNIKELTLRHIYHPRLLQFSNTPNPCLETVHLHRVGGLHNQELFTFLSSVASTLKSITLKACDIERSSRNEEHDEEHVKKHVEEHALDALIHKLTAIEYMSLSGDGASAHVLARKPARGKRSGYIWMELAFMDSVDILAALETTGWGEISIILDEFNLSPEDEVLNKKARKVAKAKGIAFTSSYPTYI